MFALLSSVALAGACGGGTDGDMDGGTDGGGQDNAAPVADAGPAQRVLQGALVTLDGSGSLDADGDALSYAWTFTSLPGGSGAQLSDAAAVAPTFAADLEGAYVLELVVNDGRVDSAADTVTITASPVTPPNTAPVADAGVAQRVHAGTVVTLDGSGSLDADGDALSYAWTFTSLPGGSGAQLSDAAAVAPTFTADLEGAYGLELVVNDGQFDSAPSPVTVFAYATPARAAVLPDTGQVTTYTTVFGEDSSYPLHAMSFTDNGDGTVTDNVTGLMWQAADDGVVYNWYEATGLVDATYNAGGAVDRCGALSLGDYDDWRLPRIKELVEIVDFDTDTPALDVSVFPAISASAAYWSATAYAPSNRSAWTIGFQNGFIINHNKGVSERVVCVRGSELPATMLDNNNGTVSDQNTGLMWQAQDDGTKRDWASAVAYCEGLTLGTHTDWRLPNVKALLSIVNHDASSPASYAAFFPATRLNDYWSSTIQQHRTTLTAWTVSTTYGNLGGFLVGTGYNYFVRCVRGG